MSKIPKNLNLVIVALTLMLNISVLLAPLISLSTVVIILILSFDVLILRVTNLHWHIIHEGIHNHLHPNPKVNDRLSRILAILLFASFNMVRFGHLLHHRVNRQSYEIDTCKQPESLSFKDHCHYYFIILGGHYLIYIFALGFLFFLPRSKIYAIGIKMFGEQFAHDDVYLDKAINHLKRHIKGIKLFKIRMDFTIVLALVMTLVIIYSHHLMIFLGYLALRAMFFSYYDNMPHYATETFGDINAARNSYLPKPLSRIFLNFNYHRVHHEYPILPWNQLPDEFQKQGYQFDDDMLANYFEQLNGINIEKLTSVHTT